MRLVNKQQMLTLCQQEAGPFSVIMKEAWAEFKSAIDLALADPEAMQKMASLQTKLLSEKLKKAGYIIVEDDGWEKTVKVMVYKAKPGTSDIDENQLCAAGHSGDYNDALHHAFLGAIREEVARSIIKAEAEKRNLAISKNFYFFDSKVATKAIGQPELFFKLERAIIEGQFSDVAVVGCRVVLDNVAASKKE